MSYGASSNGPDPPSGQAIDSLSGFATELMSQNVPTAEIERQLVERGLAPEAAAEIVQQLGRARADAVKSAGKRNMFYGAVWCIGGTLVMMLTYQSAASGPTGGRYGIAWGAIAIGALQFLWGLFQTTRR